MGTAEAKAQGCDSEWRALPPPAFLGETLSCPSGPIPSGTPPTPGSINYSLSVSHGLSFPLRDLRILSSPFSVRLWTGAVP